MARRKGTRGSDPLDQDPAAQNRYGHDLIWAIASRSGGWGASWATAAAEHRRGSAPRRRVAGVSEAGVPGAD